MSRSSLFRLALVIGFLAAALTGCSRDPNVRKQKYFESGQRYFEKGHYKEAVIQFRNATGVDSMFVDAHYQLALSYMKVQDWQHAYMELSRTLELQPEHYKAKADLANLLIATSRSGVGSVNLDQIKTAQGYADSLLEKRPNDPESHIVAANLSGVQQKYDQALSETQKAISLAPDHGDYYMDLALLQTQMKQFDAAEKNYKKAIELKASGANPHMALAAFYQQRGRYPEAEQQVRDLIAADPKNVDYLSTLAKLYMAEGKKTETEAFLKQVKQDVPDDSAAYRMLGDYYFAVGDLDKALAEYESLFHDHSKDLQTEKNYIQLLILKNRLDEAHKLNSELLKSRPNDDEALTYRGEIFLQRGKPEDAVNALQSAISNNRDNAVAHFQLGLALGQTSNLDHAGTEWQEAARLNPNMIEAHRALAALAVQKADMSQLEQSANQIVRLQPASPDGYAMRALSLMARKRYPDAEQDARKAIQIAPQSAEGYLQMGNLNTLMQKPGEAENWYKQALTRDPASSDGLRGLVTIYLARKDTDKAVTTLKNQIAVAPNNSIFYDLLGSVLLNKKDYAGAEAALQKSVEISPKNVDAYIKLGQSQTARGAVEDALATYQAAHTANPQEPALQILLGGIYERKHDLEKAKSAYEAALQLKNDNPLASNNLAYVLLETKGNVDIALQLARTARRGMPESSSVADTLGWAFYQKGIYRSAIDMFQEAIKLAAKNKEPDNATYHYHLGLAYAKAEQPALAKQHFERVLRIDPKYSDADDVRKELAQLKS